MVFRKDKSSAHVEVVTSLVQWYDLHRPFVALTRVIHKKISQQIVCFFCFFLGGGSLQNKFLHGKFVLAYFYESRKNKETKICINILGNNFLSFFYVIQKKSEFFSPYFYVIQKKQFRNFC
jgi:hypothetical protein